jgi:hypothetical protein
LTALVTVNQGTPPAGSDGDTVRAAFTKVNSNVTVLQTQAALTLGPTITTAQALTAAHVGKRININLSTAGVVNLPSAATCLVDSVILLRNTGTTIVTLAITTGSGDTVALSKLNPGEAALMDTDGVHAWSVLMRGRTNSDNETVNGNCTVNGNETVGGTLNVTGASTLASVTVTGNATVGSLILPDGTSLATAVPTPVGQCYLTQSGSSVVLTRKYGSYLTIQGIARQIPAAGVTLAGTGITANTLYYIYAFMSGQTMTLEASTTTHVVDPATGVDVKSGDTSRTLVGMVYATLAGSFAASAQSGLFTPINCLSFFNRKLKVTSAINNGGQAQADTIWLSAIVANWADEIVEANAEGWGSTPTSGNTSTIYIAYNGNGLGTTYRYSNNTGGYSFPVGFGVTYGLAEGAYAWQLRGSNDGQLLTMTAALFLRTRG